MRGRLALAALSGVLTFVAFPGVGAWPFAFVAWAPLLLAIEGTSARRAALLGFVAGLAATLPGFRFLYPTLRAESGFGPVACALLVIAVAAYHALRGLVVGLVSRLDARTTPPASAALASEEAAPPPSAGRTSADAAGAPSARPASAGPPSVLFLAGLVASEIAVPSLFPWYFGASVHRVPMLLQIAELGGPVAVSVVVAMGSVALAETLSALRADRRTRPRVILPALVLPIVAAFWGTLRIPEIDARQRSAEPLVVGVVQPHLAGVSEPVAVQRLRNASHDLAAKGADFIVWPEGAVPWVLPAPLVEDAFAMIRAPAVPILTGALVQGPSAPPPSLADTTSIPPSVESLPPPAFARVSNSALLFDAGRLAGRYDKHHLLPFSESLPLEGVFPSLRELSPHSGNFAPGSGVAPLVLRGHPMAVFICYEDLFPAHVRALTAGHHVEILVNLTNDSWFAGTDEPWVHMALARLRAVEQRKYLVRATLSGKSVVFDPVGREIATLPEDQEGAFLAEARFLPGSTVYARLGDVPWWLFAATSIAYALWRRRSEGRPTPQAHSNAP